jgi:hypothetical protein
MLDEQQMEAVIHLQKILQDMRMGRDNSTQDELEKEWNTHAVKLKGVIPPFITAARACLVFTGTMKELLSSMPQRKPINMRVTREGGTNVIVWELTEIIEGRPRQELVHALATLRKVRSMTQDPMMDMVAIKLNREPSWDETRYTERFLSDIESLGYDIKPKEPAVHKDDACEHAEETVVQREAASEQQGT